MALVTATIAIGAAATFALVAIFAATWALDERQRRLRAERRTAKAEAIADKCDEAAKHWHGLFVEVVTSFRALKGRRCAVCLDSDKNEGSIPLVRRTRTRATAA